MHSLGNDLAIIRNKKGLSIKHVQESTRIPVPILESIEDDAIFEQINKNTTYTRNYVRSYARAIGVKESDIIEALNQVQRGIYEGGLITEERPSPPPPPAESIPKDEADTTPKKEDSVSSVSNEEPEIIEQDLSPAEDLEEDSTKDLEEKGKNDGVPEKQYSSPGPQNFSPGDWDWVNVGEKAKTSSDNSSKNILLIIVFLIIVIIAGLIIYHYVNPKKHSDATGNAQNAVGQTVPLSDSLRQVLKKHDQWNQPKLITSARHFPDTAGAIFAADAKPRPIRIYYTFNNGKHNPYGAAKGENDESIS